MPEKPRMLQRTTDTAAATTPTPIAAAYRRVAASQITRGQQRSLAATARPPATAAGFQRSRKCQQIAEPSSSGIVTLPDWIPVSTGVQRNTIP